MSTASQLLLDQVARQNRELCNRLNREQRAKLQIVAAKIIRPARLCPFIDTKTGRVEFVEYRGP